MRYLYEISAVCKGSKETIRTDSAVTSDKSFHRKAMRAVKRNLQRVYPKAEIVVLESTQ